MISTRLCGPGPQSTLSELPLASSWASSRTSRSPGRGPKRQGLSFMRILIQATVWLVLVADSSTSLAEDTAPSCAQISGKAMLQAELFFGRDIAAHSRVSRAQWSDFLGREVTRRFPDGLTVFAAFGQWRDTGARRITREPSFVVRVIAAETPETMERLTQIRSAYMQRFHQQSVGLTLSTTCASF